MKPLFFAKEEKIIVSNRKSLFFSKDKKNKVKQSKRMLSEESGCPVCLSLHAGNFSLSSDQNCFIYRYYRTAGSSRTIAQYRKSQSRVCEKVLHTFR